MTGLARHTVLAIVFAGLALAFAEDTPSSDSTWKTFRVGGDVRPPVILHQVGPERDFTDLQILAAKNAHGTDTVVIYLVVTPHGDVRDPRVKRSMGEPFDSIALQAVRRWTFQPATKAGQPVAVAIAVEVQFVPRAHQPNPARARRP